MEKPASTQVFLCREVVDTLHAGHVGDDVGV